MITLENIKNHGEYIIVESAQPLRTFSSAMYNAGYGNFTYFMNRTVDKNYNPVDANEEIREYIKNKGYPLDQTVAMMTAVDMEFAQTATYKDEDTAITLLVTAGLGNAVDVTRSHEYAYRAAPGTINMFIFINGNCSDEALIQALCCAVEVKTKVLHDKGIHDLQSNSLATGTSTDSVLIAATQQGEFHQYGGSITRLGSLIGKGLYETLHKAVDEYIAFIEGVK